MFAKPQDEKRRRLYEGSDEGGRKLAGRS